MTAPQPRWAARAAVAHLFDGVISACRALRWSDDWRVLRRPHHLDECRTCLARSEQATSLRIDSSKACKCGETKRVTWYELDDGRCVARCRACARKRRVNA